MGTQCSSLSNKTCIDPGDGLRPHLSTGAASDAASVERRSSRPSPGSVQVLFYRLEPCVFVCPDSVLIEFLSIAVSG